ncbi:hypothetical protein ACFQE1_08585 [Halobium palmae]|uniref:Uncharacterized protein n=1 Tax=Halobium palmae TaxID=1776492 RepID=A0ABD5RZI3_9EURY
MRHTYAEKRAGLRVPVGQTPVPLYATWEEHRAAISRDATKRRRAFQRTPSTDAGRAA